MIALRLDPRVAASARDSGCRFVVTGASGWIGMSALHVLADALGDEFETRVAAFGSTGRDLALANGRIVRQAPLADLAALPPCPTIVLHFAFLTKDRAEAMNQTDYRAACEGIDSTVIGALEGIGANAIIVASSGAAEYADDPNASPAMRLYGSLKREQENRFAAWAEDHRARAVIARIFNLSGPYINKQSSYALSAFIADALRGGPIVIAADRPVVRAYVAVRELLSLALAMALDDQAGPARFNSGGVPMEIQAIAESVGAQLGVADIRRPPLAGARPDIYHGDAEAYQALLDAYSIEAVPFASQVAETIEFMRDFQTD